MRLFTFAPLSSAWWRSRPLLPSPGVVVSLRAAHLPPWSACRALSRLRQLRWGSAAAGGQWSVKLGHGGAGRPVSLPYTGATDGKSCSYTSLVS